jgi:hypothetical protein
MFGHAVTLNIASEPTANLPEVTGASSHSSAISDAPRS